MYLTTEEIKALTALQGGYDRDSRAMRGIFYRGRSMLGLTSLTPLISLVDMGLAQQRAGAEFRITNAGSEVLRNLTKEPVMPTLSRTEQTILQKLKAREDASSRHPYAATIAALSTPHSAAKSLAQQALVKVTMVETRSAGVSTAVPAYGLTAKGRSYLENLESEKIRTKATEAALKVIENEKARGASWVTLRATGLTEAEATDLVAQEILIRTMVVGRNRSRVVYGKGPKA